MPWVAVEGIVEFSGPLVTFKGKPTKYQDQEGKEQVGLGVGLAINSDLFAGGEISAKVKFSKVGPLMNGCGTVVYYDPTNRSFLSAGLGGPGTMYVIRLWDGNKWINHAGGGQRDSLQADREYDVKITVRGSRVTLAIDGVDVLGTVVPYSIPPSQTGIHFLDDSDICVSDFTVKGRRGRVFVAMQFTSPFMELHEEVIKVVCREFGLEAHRADESYQPGLIVEDVTREIIESEFVIAEITPANPNVYYEVGFAHALNKQVILLAEREGGKLPFDISGNRVLFYENSILGKRKFEEGLRNHIASILQKSPLASTQRLG